MSIILKQIQDPDYDLLTPERDSYIVSTKCRWIKYIHRKTAENDWNNEFKFPSNFIKAIMNEWIDFEYHIFYFPCNQRGVQCTFLYLLFWYIL